MDTGASSMEAAAGNAGWQDLVACLQSELDARRFHLSMMGGFDVDLGEGSDKHACRNVLRVQARVPFAGYDMLAGWFKDAGMRARLAGYIACPGAPDSISSSTPARSGAAAPAPVKLADDGCGNVDDSSKGAGGADDGTGSANGTNNGTGRTSEAFFDITHVAVLDIETLDLRDAPVVAIGTATFRHDEIVIDQFVLLAIDSERDLLAAFLDKLIVSGIVGLVTFYGRNFDVPFLTRRVHRWLGGTMAGTNECGIDKSGGGSRDGPSGATNELDRLRHLDLHVLFKDLYPGLKNYNFKAMERSVLDVQGRDGDISGREVIQKYTEYERATSPEMKARALACIIKHNFTDVVHAAFAMYALVGKIAGYARVKVTPGTGHVDVSFSSGSTSRSSVPSSLLEGIGPREMDTGSGSDHMFDAIPSVEAMLVETGARWEGSNDILSDSRAIDILSAAFEQPADIPAARQILTRDHPDLAKRIDETGWFFTIEQARARGILKRCTGGDRLAYQRCIPTSLESTRAACVEQAPEENHEESTGETSIRCVLPDRPCEPAGSVPGGYIAENRDTTAPILDTVMRGAGKPEEMMDVAGQAVGLSRDMNVDSSIHSRVARDADHLDDMNGGSIQELATGQGAAGCCEGPSQLASHDVFEQPLIGDIIKGWLEACGNLNVSDAAAALGIQESEIKLFLFSLIGRGILRAKFDNGTFWLVSLPSPAGSNTCASASGIRTAPSPTPAIPACKGNGMSMNSENGADQP
ncbi:MAG: ribonuclease H-like domain-containing protein [Candidatus Sigynarchaeota archaeon]